jgi:hypothetical protein
MGCESGGLILGNGLIRLAGGILGSLGCLHVGKRLINELLGGLTWHYGSFWVHKMSN